MGDYWDEIANRARRTERSPLLRMATAVAAAEKALCALFDDDLTEEQLLLGASVVAATLPRPTPQPTVEALEVALKNALAVGVIGTVAAIVAVDTLDLLHALQDAGSIASTERMNEAIRADGSLDIARLVEIAREEMHAAPAHDGRDTPPGFPFAASLIRPRGQG